MPLLADWESSYYSHSIAFIWIHIMKFDLMQRLVIYLIVTSVTDSQLPAAAAVHLAVSKSMQLTMALSLI